MCSGSEGFQGLGAASREGNGTSEVTMFLTDRTRKAGCVYVFKRSCCSFWRSARMVSPALELQRGNGTGIWASRRAGEGSPLLLVSADGL